MKDGQAISWAHIVSTVEEDMTRSLVRLPRIRKDHIRLSLSPAYESIHDPRLVWLNNGFLKLLNGSGADQIWKEPPCSVLQTSEGLKITSYSFIALAKGVLSEPGAE